LIESAKILPIL